MLDSSEVQLFPHSALCSAFSQPLVLSIPWVTGHAIRQVHVFCNKTVWVPEFSAPIQVLNHVFQCTWTLPSLYTPTPSVLSYMEPHIALELNFLKFSAFL